MVRRRLRVRRQAPARPLDPLAQPRQERRRGTTHEIAGNIVDAPLFRVCTSCGKLDTSTGANTSAEHRPWCPQRKASTEKTASIALARSLRTEGLVMRLPTSVTVGDGFSMPSLSAAVLLALRERLGGSPDHIEITSIVDPTRHDSGQNPSALLLHDKVPGDGLPRRAR
ncbi:DUF1998 domain-containing protein [Oerskovia sp. M15]